MYVRPISTLLLSGRSTPAIRAIAYPCRCLCFGFEQMIRTTPCRRTILHLLQILLTDERTFINHLYRYVIRPLVKSYGDNSTRTLSPGRMRMKCLRILPEMCASTLCLFSSSTWNIAFGNVSRTVPVTSIASSFDMFLLLPQH